MQNLHLKCNSTWAKTKQQQKFGKKQEDVEVQITSGTIFILFGDPRFLVFFIAVVEATSPT